MISTNNIPSNFANAISPFSNQGGNPVGEENPEARNTSFKPVEETAETARTQGRRDADELREGRDTRNPVEERSQGDEQRREQEREQQAREAAQQSVERWANDLLAAWWLWKGWFILTY